MLEILTSPQSQVFVIALTVMIMIALLEGVAMLLGAGLSEFLETMLPDFDVDMDIDLDGPQSHPPAFTRFLSWLRIGQVPILMVIVVFLTAFGLIGISLQLAASRMLGFQLPQWIAVAPTIFAALPVTRALAGIIGLIMPKDETTAVAEATFIGRIATITLGTASSGSPAEAKLQDEHGQVHYIMVEPDDAHAVFAQGSEVLITQQVGSTFKGIANEHSALVD